MNNAFSPAGDAGLRLKYTNQYRVARYNLLLAIIFTLVNSLLALMDGSVYFLFSISFPYFIVDLGMLLCGMYPPEFYEGEMAELAVLDPAFIVIPLVIALLCLLPYLFAFLFSSKNRVGWLIAALVLMCCDTAFLFLVMGVSADMIMDVLFHIWVIVYLIIGIVAANKLKAMPEEQPIAASVSGDVVGEFVPAPPSDLPDTAPRRHADMTVKAKILLELEVYCHRVTYRRVKRTNELVIDGYVYDEYTALLEQPHLLTARLDGHEIAVGLDPTSRSYALVDGQLAAQKLRIV